MGHYTNQCLNKKNKDKQKKKVVAIAEVDEFSTWFTNEFSLIACLSILIVTSVLSSIFIL